MKIKLTDFLNFMTNSNTIPELKIKTDLLYGEKFDVILDNFLEKMGYKIDQETLSQMTLRDLRTFLELLGKNYEETNKTYILNQRTFEYSKYTRYMDEYYLPDCFKFENISINI